MMHDEEIEALKEEIARSRTVLANYAETLGDEDRVIRGAIRWLLGSTIAPHAEWNDLVRKAHLYEEACATFREMARWLGDEQGTKDVKDDPDKRPLLDRIENDDGQLARELHDWVLPVVELVDDVDLRGRCLLLLGHTMGRLSRAHAIKAFPELEKEGRR